ncbi:OLC1v1009703C1 [Oldenlandia corymbosa var. corymbosa]|uniref:OLC1v1009703C1 n=1 Tax=Oldenlandia corymbosa var. corymbosa TaxID=529605 RepID=A0AAV1DSI7_OLDCO|nr:OLC1v1009703C1 [Oldenlandia corymbosa var. corymbosa]
MDLKVKSTGSVTPGKDSKLVRSKTDESIRSMENRDPNLSSPGMKATNSPSVKSATKGQKSSAKKCHNSPNLMASPPNKNKIRERRFVVAKKNSKSGKVNSSAAVVCKCGNKGVKCVCVAYESLRASQEEFFKNRGASVEDDDDGNGLEKSDGTEERQSDTQNRQGNVRGFGDKVFDDGSDPKDEQDGDESSSEIAVANTVKRRRDKLMEAARQSVPEAGSGRVLHLVKAFEQLLTIPKSTDSEENDEKEKKDSKKGTKWALPGLQSPSVPETQVSSSSFCPSDFLLTSESLGLDSRVNSSLDSSQGSFSFSSRMSDGSRRSRRNSAESSGTFSRRQWKRKQQLRTTSQKPFRLRTEQRGSCKQEEFFKKLKQKMEEEEKMRIPIAQGLPWTTDEPECLVKPPVKETTVPVDLMLHSDIRAVERAEFDHQVAEKLSLIEEYKMERERQQKLAEEEEIRRLRKELVPKAQPMPYFDRPFIPRRYSKLISVSAGQRNIRLYQENPSFMHINKRRSNVACRGTNFAQVSNEGKGIIENLEEQV